MVAENFKDVLDLSRNKKMFSFSFIGNNKKYDAYVKNLNGKWIYDIIFEGITQIRGKEETKKEVIKQLSKKMKLLGFKDNRANNIEIKEFNDLYTPSRHEQDVEVDFLVIKDKKNHQIIKIQAIGDMYEEVFFEITDNNGVKHSYNCEAKDVNGLINSKGLGDMYIADIIKQNVKVSFDL